MSVIARKGTVALACLVVMMGLAATPVAASNAVTEEAPVTWEWDDTAIGVSSLTRTDDGLHVRLRATGLTPGDTVTLWIGKFDNPAACSATPCPRPADVGNPATQADLFWADGVVVGPSGIARFEGTLAVGQTEGSLKAERGIAPAVPLVDPFGAEVAVALHSHGPVQPGLLREQLTTFLGGCDVLTGVAGFATGPADLPDEPGECTTFAAAAHLVP